MCTGTEYASRRGVTSAPRLRFGGDWVTEFAWHEMRDGAPEDGDAKYLLVGKRGAMYMAHGFKRVGTRDMFYVPNNRSNLMEFDLVKAWAAIPPYEGGA